MNKIICADSAHDHLTIRNCEPNDWLAVPNTKYNGSVSGQFLGSITCSVCLRCSGKQEPR